MADEIYLKINKSIIRGNTTVEWAFSPYKSLTRFVTGDYLIELGKENERLKEEIRKLNAKPPIKYDFLIEEIKRRDKLALVISDKFFKLEEQNKELRK